MNLSTWCKNCGKFVSPNFMSGQIFQVCKSCLEEVQRNNQARKEEFKSLLRDTLDDGWGLDYHEAIGYYADKYERYCTRFNEDIDKLLELHDNFETDENIAAVAFEDLVTEDDPYHYTNPRSVEIRGLFLERGEDFTSYYAKLNMCEKIFKEKSKLRINSLDKLC